MTNIWMQLLHMLRSLWPSQQRSRMYWLLRHAQNARDINIHKLHHPLPEKNRLGPCRFSAHGTGYIEIAVFVLWLIFLPISVRIFQNKHCSFCSKEFNHDFQWRKSVVEPVALKKPRLLSMPISITIFCTVEHPFNWLQWCPSGTAHARKGTSPPAEVHCWT